MLNHLFKLIWRKKKSNFLMMLEIFVSFLILFAVWSLTVYTWRNHATPSGLVAEDVWAVFFDFNTDSAALEKTYREQVRQRVLSFPEVRSVAFSSGNIPFSFSTSNRVLSREGREVISDVMNVDISYPEVLGIPLSKGRWFNAEDTIGSTTPVVVTRHFAREMFGQEDPVGQIMGDEDDRRKVVGVVDYFRHKSSFQEDDNCVFEPTANWSNVLLLRMNPGSDATVEARLARSLQQLGKTWVVEVQHLEQMRATQDKTVLVPILILFTICFFLVFNVGLGLFGVLFQNISRRKGEIGIRRALGATASGIMWYFIGETLVIATFGVVLGIFFAAQAPLLNVLDVEAGIYGWGILFATLSIYLMAALCAFYPSRQAARIYPATALHEE